MTLSKTELALARKATWRVQFYEGWRKLPTYWLALGYCLLVFPVIVGSTVDAWHRSDLFDVIFRTSVLVLLLVQIPLGIQKYCDARRRYPDDSRFLADLRQKAGGELPFSQPRTRAILWRLDAFLSRRPSSS